MSVGFHLMFGCGSLPLFPSVAGEYRIGRGRDWEERSGSFRWGVKQ